MHEVPPFFAPDRYSTRKMVKPINFFCVAPTARGVSVLGDFNAWDPGSHPMKRQPDGNWLLQIPLHHGHHHYVFLVDGKAVLDPRAQGVARNQKGDRVSLLSVS